MKALLLCFFLCVFHVSVAHNGAGPAQLKNIQTRPLHKPESQNTPLIVPVPVYTPVPQQPPIQQYPIQQIPIQYPPPQFVPVHQIPVHYQHHYPQMHRPHIHHHHPQYYPQYFHGVPC